MCGIAGVVSAHGTRIDVNGLAAMAAMLSHRGPDGQGIHVEPAAGLAHTRLSIIDVEGGAQPMSNEDDSLWIAFNGEIFNYLELRDDLVRKGHVFRTKSDTEVLLHLYEEVGERLVDHLNGQWAFGLWDRRSGSLLLSRDRLGVRPLFYTQQGSQLLFASEIKALFADPRVSREIDPAALDDIFTFWTTTSPRTIFSNIREVPPGHSLTWRNGHTELKRYWQPTFDADPSHEPPSAEASGEALLAHLTEATRLRLRSDVPVGAYLSGGLDSSLIAALLTRSAGLQDGSLRTFSLAFDDAEFDERAYQQQVAAALGTDHSEVRCSADDIARVFPDVVWHAETPFLRTAPAPMFLLAQHVRESGCKVVMTGEGADEIFGGYDIFKEAKIRRFWAKSPSSMRRASLLRRLYPYQPQLQRESSAFVRSFFQVSPSDLAHPCFSHLPRWRMTSALKLFFSDAIGSALGARDAIADVTSGLPELYGGWDRFCQSQYLEIAQLLPGYILSSQGDRMAMAHGVEARFPFLDRDVVSFGSTLAPTLKMRGLTEKHLLKKIARDLLPPAIWQRSKQPYRAPGAAPFVARGGVEYVRDLLSESQIRRDGLFRGDLVAALVRKHRDGRAIGVKDEMALVGVLSTQLLVHRFINNFPTVPHGTLERTAAAIHR